MNATGKAHQNTRKPLIRNEQINIFAIIYFTFYYVNIYPIIIL